MSKLKKKISSPKSDEPKDCEVRVELNIKVSKSYNSAGISAGLSKRCSENNVNDSFDASWEKVEEEIIKKLEVVKESLDELAED